MKKTIISLLQELRSYIIILCCFVLISFIACFFVKTQLYDIITRPLHIVLHKTLFLNMEVDIEQLFIDSLNGPDIQFRDLLKKPIRDIMSDNSDIPEPVKKKGRKK